MDDVLALRRAGEVKKVGDARRVYEAQQRSGWDTYYTVRTGPPDARLVQDGAIEAARAGDVRRLVDCLRGRKPLTDDDRNRLVDYIATRARRRYWPPELVCALSKLPTEEKDYDWLADFVGAVGRRRGGVLDAPVHRAARLAEVFTSLVRGRVPAPVRTAMIERACEIEGDEAGIVIDPERVHDLLKHPKARRRQQ
jgi:hypothetical protein